MALVKLDTGVPMFKTSRTGDCFYVRNGKQLVRQVVKPVYPASRMQLWNVNGIAMASRAWKNLLTPDQIATWYTPCLWGWPGSPWMQAIWSLILWIWNQIPLADWTGTCPDPNCPVDVSIDAVAGTFLVTVGDSVGSSFRGYVAASAPQSVGRVPRPEMTRVLAVGVEPGSTIDIGPAYIARFGRLPTSGVVGVLSRFADISDGSATDVCFEIFPVNGASEDLHVVVSPDTVDIVETVGGSFSAEASETTGPTTSVNWSILGCTIASFSDPGETGLGVPAVFDGTALVVPGGPETCIVRATSVQSGFIADGEIIVTTSGMP